MMPGSLQRKSFIPYPLEKDNKKDLFNVEDERYSGFCCVRGNALGIKFNR